ncbi:uncharacterized protein LOC117677869 [Pantherophis guttatus]|uniref:Uncharacterized protein LOC117677869 n=1 Tax=Pantherophis guttatus TaxID=94885 RepID=A0A6P9DF78_PANGU|nr:uncharacterized protein LOC117677869 [Pantherophis guttatus]
MQWTCSQNDSHRQRASQPLPAYKYLTQRRSPSQRTRTDLNSGTMASFVLFIFIISLLPVARTTKCSQCFNDGGPSCSVSVQRNCTNEEKCFGVISTANLSIDQSLTTSSARSCVASANQLTGSFHFDFGDKRTLSFDSEICNVTDGNCPWGLPGDSMRIYENGKSCPKCYRTGYDNCESDGDVFCVGDFVNCTEVNGEISNFRSGTKIPFAGKGCVSQSVCSLQGKSFQHGSYKFTFKKVQCSKANGALSSLRRLAFTLEKKDLGPQAAFFFPCILGIFAVKILS